MSRMIKITAGDIVARARLKDTPTAAAIFEAIPFEGVTEKWQNEIYFPVPVRAELENDARGVLESGELGFWPEGQTLCIFFGTTGDAENNETRDSASAVNVLASLVGDWDSMRNIPEGVEIRIEKIEGDEADNENHEDIAEAKTQAKVAPVDVKARAKQIAELTAAYEKLQRELSKQKQTENTLKEDREQLEQRITRQVTELTAANEQLQGEITKRLQLEQRLRQQADELTAANKQIQQTNSDRKQASQQLKGLNSKLKALEKQLQQERTRRRQADEELADLRTKMDNIHSIARKYS